MIITFKEIKFHGSATKMTIREEEKEIPQINILKKSKEKNS